MGNIEALVPKMDPIRFAYQHVVCLYTFFKSRINEKECGEEWPSLL